MAFTDCSYKIIEGIPNTDFIEALKNVYQLIFNDADLPFFENRLLEKNDILSIVAFQDSEVIGFKIGYRYDVSTFYSWIGGVKSEHRGKGIGRKLSELQEQMAIKMHYKKLRTKSMNRFKPMMILNLKRGFNIVNIYKNSKEQTKIVFEKLLV